MDQGQLGTLRQTRDVFASNNQVGPSWAVFGAPGPNLGAPSFSKLVHNLRLGPPLARSTFVPRCSNRLGPPEPSDRQVGPSWAQLGRFWALEVPNLKNFVSGKWNEARGTLKIDKNMPVDPNGKKNFGPPPLTHCVLSKTSQESETALT